MRLNLIEEDDADSVERNQRHQVRLDPIIDEDLLNSCSNNKTSSSVSGEVSLEKSGKIVKSFRNQINSTNTPISVVPLQSGESGFKSSWLATNIHGSHNVVN